MELDGSGKIRKEDYDRDSMTTIDFMELWFTRLSKSRQIDMTGHILSDFDPPPHFLKIGHWTFRNQGTIEVITDFVKLRPYETPKIVTNQTDGSYIW